MPFPFQILFHLGAEPTGLLNYKINVYSTLMTVDSYQNPNRAGGKWRLSPSSRPRPPAGAPSKNISIKNPCEALEVEAPVVEFVEYLIRYFTRRLRLLGNFGHAGGNQRE